LAVVGVAVAACGQAKQLPVTPLPPASVADTPGAAITLTTGVIIGSGRVLVDGQGQTLYGFTSDSQRQVTCTARCASVWRPLVLTSGQRVRASGGVQRGLVGSDPYPGGAGRVVTYDRWPLYRFDGDLPGEATSDQLPANGGTWFALTVSGQPD
jgi:predicted lipoprotein with Yx(FWY)xxD motif